jgi:hypothetical protein
MDFYGRFSVVEEWTPVTTWGLSGYVVAALLIVWLACTGGHWVFLLDSANLAFHEAGHPLFGLLSDRLTVYGGTLGQLLFPLAAGVSFFRQRAALCFGWARICSISPSIWQMRVPGFCRWSATGSTTGLKSSAAGVCLTGMRALRLWCVSRVGW